MSESSPWRLALVALTLFTSGICPTFADEAKVVAETQSNPGIAALERLDRLDARVAAHQRSLDAEGERAQQVSQRDVGEMVRLLHQLEAHLRRQAIDPALWSERVRTADERLRELSRGLAGVERRMQHAGEISPTTQGGAIRGRVTATSGDLPPFSDVVVFEMPSGRFLGSTSVDDEGRYVVPLPAGEYVVRARADGHRDELWNGRPCPDNCDVSDGDRVVVVDGEETTGIDFVLERLGKIAGRVTDRDGVPISGASIQLWLLGQGYAGSARADSDGRFETEGLPSGSYALVALSDKHRAELYDDMPCPNGIFHGCEAEDGASVAVGVETTTSGIEFALDPFGGLAGKVFDAATEEPLAAISVEVMSVDGTRHGSTITDADGEYAIAGLPDGEYVVWTRNNDDFYIDEVYDDIVCADRFPEDCDPTVGTPVAVQVAATTGGIDFGLDIGGEIAGRVLAAAGATPLDEIRVTPYDENGRPTARIFQTDETGHYEILGLPTGTYYVIASDEQFYGRYASQLFDHRACGDDACDPADGDPIEVVVRQRTSGIDFDLVEKGRIEGRVIDAATGSPIEGASVRAGNPTYDSRPVRTGADGTYQILGLPDDSYTVLAEAGNWISTLYPAVPCHEGECDRTTGVAVATTIGTVTTGIDIVMPLGGALSGTVRPTVADEGRLFDVAVYDETGEVVDGSRTDRSGNYRIDGLEAGTYFVEAENGVYRAEVWNDRPCGFYCTPLDGEPVEVELGAETTGIDFVLDRLPTITGTVADADSGLGIEGFGFVLFETADLQTSFDAFVGLGGTSFETGPILPGTYFATFYWGDEPYWVYGAGLCGDEFCEPTFGTPIRAEVNTDITNIDIRFRRRQGIVGRVTAGNSGVGVAGIDVSFWNADTLDLAGSTVTGSTGGYSRGLFAGEYFVSTSNDQGGADEVWNDVPCPNGPSSNDCDLASADRVEVTASTLTPGIDFALDGLEVGCQASSTTLCLNDGRFQVLALWRDADGTTNEFGRVQAITADTGYFWFFDPDNVEVIVKVLDACGTPFERFWVFAAGLTDVQVSLVVTDLASGETRTYDNALGTPFQPVQDTDAFATCGFGSGVRSPESGSSVGASRSQGERRGGVAKMDCPADVGTLCLGAQRFHVEATWRSGDGGGSATAEPLTDDTGYFWFFGPDNVEVVVKVLDACGAFDRFWVFAAGLTDVELELKVTDTETGQEREYTNVLGAPFQPIFDTDAFTTCSP